MFTESTSIDEFYGSKHSLTEEEFKRFVETIPVGIREIMTRPLPADFDIDDCLTDEELDAIRQLSHVSL